MKPFLILRVIYIVILIIIVCTDCVLYLSSNVYVKILAFSKWCSCLTEYAVIVLYAHTMLPFLEYAGFMLISCNINDRQGLKNVRMML